MRLFVVASLRPALAGVLVLAAACAGEDPATGAPNGSPASAELLAAPASGTGIQYAMTTELSPGSEVEHCKFVRAPAEGMLVNHDAVRFTRGSHHVLLYRTEYDDIPTVKRDGTPVDTRGVFDCSVGANSDWELSGLIGGSQNGDGESMLAFPEGVGVRVEPGAVLLINAHYINTTAEVLRPELRINLYTVSEAELREEGDLLLFYNPFISAKAGTRSRARMRCPIDHDITLTNVQSHMHARGVGYAAMVEGEAPFYTNEAWEGVPVLRFDDGGMRLRAGQRLDYYCDFENVSDTDVYQGLRTTDEMCMLIGSYYPAYPALGSCDEEDSGGPAAEWVGEGSASCAQTLACADEAFADMEHGMRLLTDCIQRSSPAVSGALSSVLRCQLAPTHGDAPPDCASELALCAGQ